MSKSSFVSQQCFLSDGGSSEQYSARECFTKWTFPGQEQSCCGDGHLPSKSRKGHSSKVGDVLLLQG